MPRVGAATSLASFSFLIQTFLNLMVILGPVFLCNCPFHLVVLR